MRKIPPKLDEIGLWDYALRLLAHRPYSVGELERKLALRADSGTTVAAAIAKLSEYGLADDVKFAETFAGSRLRNRGFGRSRVLQELRARCVPQSLANEVVEKAFAGTDEAQLIERYLARKYRGKDLTRVLQERKNLAAAYRNLRIAGFSSSTSLMVLKRFSQMAETCGDAEPSEEY